MTNSINFGTLKSKPITDLINNLNTKKDKEKEKEKEKEKDKEKGKDSK